MMDLDKIYYDSEGIEHNILEMVKIDPHWAANRIQEGEKAQVLVRNAVVNARPQKVGIKGVRWGCVKDILCVGKTTAIALCKVNKVDPDELLDGLICESCSLDEEE